MNCEKYLKLFFLGYVLNKLVYQPIYILNIMHQFAQKRKFCNSVHQNYIILIYVLLIDGFNRMIDITFTLSAVFFFVVWIILYVRSFNIYLNFNQVNHSICIVAKIIFLYELGSLKVQV